MLGLKGWPCRDCRWRWALHGLDSGWNGFILRRQLRCRVLTLFGAFPITIDSNLAAASSSVRIRCYDCYRPQEMCFCGKIPSIQNRTEVIVLQHMRERFHAFNTARIVHKALRHSTLLVDHNEPLAHRLDQLSLGDRVGVLYPGPGGRMLEELSPTDRPRQLVVIDGTWHHAKTLLRDIPRLNELPRYRIQPSAPGRYRIRREPNATALSTLEATVAALRSLEPDTAGLDELIRAFDAMVQAQLDHPSARTHWRRNENRQHNTMGIPRAILPDHNAELKDIVVAYGESEPGRMGCHRTPRQVDAKGKAQRQPVYWLARRLDTGETFRVSIRSPVELTTEFLAHIGLSLKDWRDAHSIEQFKIAWQSFLRPADTLIVYHASTLRLLRNVHAAAPNPAILKSVQFDPDQSHPSLASFLQSKRVEINPPQNPSRADRRLGNAIALTRYLHQLEQVKSV